MENKKLKSQIKIAKDASHSLLKLTAHQRKKVLLDLHENLLASSAEILKANEKDIRLAKKERSDSFIERLSLDEKKIHSMAETVRAVAAFPDELFQTLSEKKRPSGIKIRKVRYPLGLIAVIYESRPNVTIDSFALSFKSGNAVILKGGKEIKNTNQALVNLIKKTLKKSSIDENVIMDVSGLDRKTSLLLLQDGRIDCLIPRGGKELIDYCIRHSSIPMIITGASVVHTYVDRSADLKMAEKVIINAKARRVSICNALDVILLHKDISEEFINNICPELIAKDIEIRADEKSYKIFKKNDFQNLHKAGKNDFDTEFLDHTLAVKIVDDFDEAVDHIARHSLGHSEAIITKDKKQAERFFRDIDAACLYWNTSTQFSDGGEFGLGGEIGISTQKLHARGPFGFQELATYKYLVESEGAIRP